MIAAQDVPSGAVRAATAPSPGSMPATATGVGSGRLRLTRTQRAPNPVCKTAATVPATSLVAVEDSSPAPSWLISW